MSLDLSWGLLDDAFTQQILTKLNDVLANASRPEYIGPITLDSLTLGNEAPDVSIVDVGDVWEGFLQRDEVNGSAAAGPSTNRPAKPTSRKENGGGSGNSQYLGVPSHMQPHQRDYAGQPTEENVRRDGNLARFANKNLPFSAMRSNSPSVVYDVDTIDGLDDENEGYQNGKQSRDRNRKGPRIQAYRQYSDSGNYHRIETGSMSSFDASSVPPSGMATPSPWGAGLPHTAHGSYFSAWQNGFPPGLGAPANARSVPHSRRASWQRQSSASAMSMAKIRHGSPSGISSIPPNYHQSIWPPGDSIQSPVHEEPASSGSSLPSLQLQLSLHWITQSLRLTLNTSLVINHPSPAFMSLPLTLTITGVSIASGGLLAFEVDPATNVRRCHFCLLEEDEQELDQEEDDGGNTNAANVMGKPSHPFTNNGQETVLTPGERILYNLTLETSVGQAEKHVLKNVAKVERFVVSLVRKAIGEELVFPNFYSIELP
ncbi:uncharacterized protein FA14DRAFT_7103 [Meira miltonrushii]|uniref:Mitochondrial distribution and morphology protein 12 n=1 Tax=Meira miltonrushii TaxID=1280837 RepID=A0A316VML4_9BASI|nr:uncharacterized protein FA14DRAFT_7103 [Meira miltonrushii]PWN36805.1 hypothetical protein FA14DRAFT_7103 [Meira miltonrushii]